MPEIYGFESDVAQRLKEMAGLPTQVSKARTGPLRSRPQMIGGDALMAITPTGGIAARTTTSVPHTFPMATCRVISGVTGNYLSPDVEVDVYNSTKIPIGEAQIIQLKRIDGRYFADVDDC